MRKCTYTGSLQVSEAMILEPGGLREARAVLRLTAVHFIRTGEHHDDCRP
jgi:hypothetical protein